MRSILVSFYMMFTLLSSAGMSPALGGLPAAASQQSFTPTPSFLISSPTTGQILQGNVPVLVDLTMVNFTKGELAFSYTDDRSDTYFIIKEFEYSSGMTTPLIWDTTLISDGNYNLRLMLVDQNGASQSAVVKGLRVRNYTPAETDTPLPPATPTPAAVEISNATSAPTALPTPSPKTPTPAPANPAQISRLEVEAYLGIGVLAAAGLFVILGLYFFLANFLRGGK